MDTIEDSKPLIVQRVRATDGTALARALDYSLKRWAALTRYLDLRAG